MGAGFGAGAYLHLISEPSLEAGEEHLALPGLEAIQHAEIRRAAGLEGPARADDTTRISVYLGFSLALDNSWR
jgi:hypothetical protein